MVSKEQLLRDLESNKRTVTEGVDKCSEAKQVTTLVFHKVYAGHEMRLLSVEGYATRK